MYRNKLRFGPYLKFSLSTSNDFTLMKGEWTTEKLMNQSVLNKALPYRVSKMFEESMIYMESSIITERKTEATIYRK